MPIHIKNIFRYLIITLSLLLNSYTTIASTELSNEDGKIIQKKTIPLNSSKPELNQSELEKIIQDNNLDKEKIKILRSSQDCHPPDFNVETQNTQNEPEQIHEQPHHSGAGHYNIHIPNNSDEAAVILLVIIGAVVVIYWLTAFPALLAKASNDDGCIMTIRRFLVEYNNYHFSNDYQEASSYSVEFDFYFKHKFENSIYYGVNTILGKQELNFAHGDENAQIEKGSFFMIGPSLLFPLFSSEVNYGTSLHMDFLLGWNGNKNIGNLTTARLGIQHSDKDGIYIGAGLAANKFNINQNRDAFLKSNSQFGLSVFFRVGYEF